MPFSVSPKKHKCAERTFYTVYGPCPNLVALHGKNNQSRYQDPVYFYYSVDRQVSHRPPRRAILTRYVETNLDDDGFLEVKHDLFPVGVFCVGTGTKSYGFMAAIKADVEPCDEGVNEIVAGGTEFKVGYESEVGDGAGGKVDVEDSVWVCDDGFEVDGIDERFTHCDSSDG